MVYGSGKYLYECVPNWGYDVKRRWNTKEIAGITVDSEDHVYLLTRTVPPVIVLDRNGSILTSFGDDIFIRAHGMYRSQDGIIYGVDDGGHAVYQFSSDHTLQSVWGVRGVPSDTGCVGKDYRTIQHAAGPFNAPTRLTADTEGNIYVTDGYGNARVHKFTHDGKLLLSWGEPGEGAGQFNLPHGIAIDRNNILYVADRQNHRIQLFTNTGVYLNSWTGFYRPSDIWIDRDGIFYVAECKRTSEWNDTPSRVSIVDHSGKLLARLGDDDSVYDIELGSRCAHGICVDSEGSLYVTEVGKKLKDDFFGLRKYRRIR